MLPHHVLPIDAMITIPVHIYSQQQTIADTFVLLVHFISFQFECKSSSAANNASLSARAVPQQIMLHWMAKWQPS